MNVCMYIVHSGVSLFSLEVQFSNILFKIHEKREKLETYNFCVRDFYTQKCPS